jgi:hypothetical protein
MTKLFCDICNRELTDDYLNRIPTVIFKDSKKYEDKLIIAEITDPKEKDICMYCFIDAVNKLDDRPKAACSCH